MAAEQMTTGQRIARARRRKGWDQTTLAEMIGRSVSWLSKIENGRLPLDRMSVLGQVAEVLGVEVAELTGQPYRHETDELDGSTSIVAGRRVEGTTKSGRSRVVSIDTETVNALREHRRRQDAERLTARPEWIGSDDYVFTTGLGEPIYPDTVTSLVGKLIHAHNNPKGGQKPKKPLPHARLRDLRHIHATTLLLAGVSIHVVAARLGHADPAITLRVYAHVINEQMATAADIFATAIKEAAA